MNKKILLSLICMSISSLAFGHVVKVINNTRYILTITATHIQFGFICPPRIENVPPKTQHVIDIGVCCTNNITIEAVNPPRPTKPLIYETYGNCSSFEITVDEANPTTAEGFGLMMIGKSI